MARLACGDHARLEGGQGRDITVFKYNCNNTKNGSLMSMHDKSYCLTA